MSENYSASGLIFSALAGVLIGYLIPKIQYKVQRRIARNKNYTEDDSLDASSDYKMLLVVNMELKMGKGKVAAQCAHAAVGAVKLAAERKSKALAIWEEEGQAKVVVKVQTAAELVALGKSAAQNNIPSFIVRDAGRTQIASGSKTVLALGPAPVKAIDMITGHLKLL